MKLSRFALSVFALLMPRLLSAGTLDEAPFRVAVPSREWQIEDSAAQPMGKGVVLVATISNRKTLLKSVILNTVLKNTSDSALDEFYAGIHDLFSKPGIKRISEADTMFLGHKAKTFTYQITQDDQTSYHEATVFLADGKGWIIMSMGQMEQKDDIKKIIGFYRKKGASYEGSSGKG